MGELDSIGAASSSPHKFAFIALSGLEPSTLTVALPRTLGTEGSGPLHAQEGRLRGAQSKRPWRRPELWALVSKGLWPVGPLRRHQAQTHQGLRVLTNKQPGLLRGTVVIVKT